MYGEINAKKSDYVKTDFYWFDTEQSSIPVFNGDGKFVVDLYKEYQKNPKKSYEYIFYTTFGEGFDRYMLEGSPKLSKAGGILGEKYGKEKFITPLIKLSSSDYTKLDNYWLNSANWMHLD